MYEQTAELGERIVADTLRFVRRFSASPHAVWRAITTPEGIAAWLGRAIAIETFPGGRFAVALGEDDVMDGRIVACEPGRRLAIDWRERSDGVFHPYGMRDGDTSEVVLTSAPTRRAGRCWSSRTATSAAARR